MIRMRVSCKWARLSGRKPLGSLCRGVHSFKTFGSLIQKSVLRLPSTRTAFTCNSTRPPCKAAYGGVSSSKSSQCDPYFWKGNCSPCIPCEELDCPPSYEGAWFPSTIHWNLTLCMVLFRNWPRIQITKSDSMSINILHIPAPTSNTIPS
jgi:hypothetical protein